MSAYILCASPRSGSTLLCDLLWQTRVAGKPHSFFRPGSVAEWAAFFGLPPMDAETYDQTYIDASIQRGTMGTGTFGLRIMWDSMPGLLARLRALQGDGTDIAVLESAFGPCRFIHLQRADKAAQAVSLAIAEQTGLWHRNADGSDRENFHLADVAHYDAAQIQHEFDGLLVEQAGWATWFTRNQIAPHRVTYETLTEAPRRDLRNILAFLGHDASIADSLSPGTQRLATQMNQDWTERFRKERGLPPPPSQF